jgi:hypothetical protein
MESVLEVSKFQGFRVSKLKPWTEALVIGTSLLFPE